MCESGTSGAGKADAAATGLQTERIWYLCDGCGLEEQGIFRNPKHRNDFYSLLMGKRAKTLQYAPGYAAAEILWEKVRKNVLDTGIYFDRVRLGGVTLEQYILFHAAKDVYSGTKHTGN